MTVGGPAAPNVKAAITDAAFGLFADRGFDQVTVADVAAAGVTTEVFHEYHPTLADIVYEGLDDEYRAFEAAVENEATTCAGGPGTGRPWPMPPSGPSTSVPSGA